MKCITSNNGGEYRDSFEEYCKELEIKLVNWVPNMPHNNGVIERMSYILNDKTMCMLSHKKLTKAFRCEVMKVAMVLINVSLSILFDSDVPNNIWTKKCILWFFKSVWLQGFWLHIGKEICILWLFKTVWS